MSEPSLMRTQMRWAELRHLECFCQVLPMVLVPSRYADILHKRVQDLMLQAFTQHIEE